jgi:digeranylgeranylglycerophospholipid reductase
MAQRISIIGAGPAGSFAAMELAKRGLPVTVYEEHSRIGEPVQCTGIVTKEIETVFMPKKAVINKIGRARLFSPSGKSIDVKVNDLVLDRGRFDRMLAEAAEKAGAEIKTGHRFLGIRGNEILLSAAAADKGIDKGHCNNGCRDNGSSTLPKKQIAVKTDILIGADGPKSQVAMSCGMYGKRNFFIGKQARMSGRFEKDCFEAYFGRQIAPGFFGWVVPENESVARIGVAVYGDGKVNACFDSFVNRIKASHRLGKSLGFQGGLIPIYNTQQKWEMQLNKWHNAPSTFLLGDAALQAKATTGGGIVQGMKAAKTLAECIAEKKAENNEPEHNKIKRLNRTADHYEKRTSALRKELWLHLRLRKGLDRLSDKEMDRLFGLLEKERVKKVFETAGRDSPFALISQLALKEPRLLLFSRIFI